MRSTGSALVAFFVKEKVRSRLLLSDSSKSRVARMDGERQREGRRSGRVVVVVAVLLLLLLLMAAVGVMTVEPTS